MAVTSNKYFILMFLVVFTSCNSSSIDEQKQYVDIGEKKNYADSITVKKNQLFDSTFSLPKLTDGYFSRDFSYEYEIDWNSLIYLNASSKIMDLLTDTSYKLNRFSNSNHESEFKLFYYTDSILLVTQKNNNKIVFLLKLNNSIYGFNINNIVLSPYYLYEDERNKGRFNLLWTNHIFYLSDNCTKILSMGFGTTSEGPGNLGFIAKLDARLKPQNYLEIERNRIMGRGSFIYNDDSLKITGLKVHYSKNKSKAEMENIDSDDIIIDNFKNQLPLGNNINMFYELLVNDSTYEYRKDSYLDFKHVYDYKIRLFNSSSSSVNIDRSDPCFSIYRYIYLKAP